MNAHVRGCLVDGYQHLLAAAVHAWADVIMTFNLKDSLAEVLGPHNIEAQYPNALINHLLDLDTAAVVIAANAGQG